MNLIYLLAMPILYLFVIKGIDSFLSLYFYILIDKQMKDFQISQFSDYTLYLRDKDLNCQLTLYKQ
jgi:hypothetical protein